MYHVSVNPSPPTKKVFRTLICSGTRKNMCESIKSSMSLSFRHCCTQGCALSKTLYYVAASIITATRMYNNHQERNLMPLDLYIV